MDITVRPERVSDYGIIAGLNYSAFVNWHPAPFRAEPLIVDVLRHNAMFDPELSLVAEHEGRIVGPVLFSPFEFVVMGTRQLGTVLAPIGVEPAYQRSGIGGMLIARGHAAARDKGYAFSILCGHPSYYPRFGYRQRMFSLSGPTVAVAAVGDRLDGLVERPILAADLPWIVDAWWGLHGADSLALFPGDSISQWFSHTAGHRSSVITRGGEAVAYVRYAASSPIAISELLVRDVGAYDVLAFLLGEHDAGGAGACVVSLGEDAIGELFAPTDPVRVTGSAGTSDAFMLAVLDEGNEALARYCTEVSDGRRRPGLVTFPALLDVDG